MAIVELSLNDRDISHNPLCMFALSGMVFLVEQYFVERIKCCMVISAKILSLIVTIYFSASIS